VTVVTIKKIIKLKKIIIPVFIFIKGSWYIYWVSVFEHLVGAMFSVSVTVKTQSSFDVR
jgi:hypothetical protein|tara:strand:+ start:64 stop:240 length:177 start_codon:yes stop_codon:yes gene_type:complete